jgi:peptide-methionine (S)-S-oxide reductase
VVSTEVGYTQGIKDNPTYEEVCSGSSGHAEAVQVVFDPSAVSYEELLTVFWDIIDPTTYHRQGNDVGSQYRTGIYYHSDTQKDIATKSKSKEQKNYGESIVTEIEPATTWYPAESYHQQYLANGGQCSRAGDTTPIRCYG